MSFATGARLGPYEVSFVGSGGTGRGMPVRRVQISLMLRSSGTSERHELPRDNPSRFGDDEALRSRGGIERRTACQFPKGGPSLERFAYHVDTVLCESRFGI